ncbi:hypothetical protein [Micromonospora sp. PLK6-60]|uniref:hypothetical protein n=1 Tax=Micromonospora sp. PLK6-60 TaxID=2873383 RepID=UPI0021030A39|nr:hypothetical protein [Micromonospora sp. PLK6-60]
MTEYDSAARLTAHAGSAPVSRDSATVSGDHRQPRRFHRRLRPHSVDGRLHRRPRMPHAYLLRKEPPPSHSRASTRPWFRRPLHPARQDRPESPGDSSFGPGASRRLAGGSTASVGGLWI